MSRPLRIEYPGALYHVVSRGNGRLWLFKHDDAYSTFLDVLEEYIKKYYVVIHNFVIMRNHFHLIVETKLPNLGIFMDMVWIWIWGQISTFNIDSVFIWDELGSNLNIQHFFLEYGL